MEETAVAVAETVVDTVVETATSVAPAAIPIAITALAYTGAGAIALGGCYGIYRASRWGYRKYKARKAMKEASVTTPAHAAA